MFFVFFPCECTAETVVVDVTVMHCSDPRWKNSVVTSEEGAGFLEGGVFVYAISCMTGGVRVHARVYKYTYAHCMFYMWHLTYFVKLLF